MLGRVAQLAHERAQRPAELERPSGLVALPERGLRGLAGRGRDDHPVEGDLLDAPRGRAEHEALADAALVDHLLVELADPGTVGQEHAEQAAVGDRAAARHGNVLRAFSGRAPGSACGPTRRVGAGRRTGRRGSGPASMSRVSRNTSSERSEKFAARRTSASSSSTSHSSSAVAATICCASTSSGLRG